MAGDLHSFEEIMLRGLKLKIHPEKVSRVGKPKEDKPRLMVVTMHEERDKWGIMKMAAKSLRHAGDKFERIYIALDLSPAEQERDWNLRKELRERSLTRWSLRNGFRFSTDKSVCLHFCRRTRHCSKIVLCL